MKYSSWPVVKLSIGGETLAAEQDNGSMHVGTTVWPCSLVLAKWAERQMLWEQQSSSSPGPLKQLQGKRAIELGAGCGLAGMALSLLLRLDLTLLTDVPPVLSALKRNLKKNLASTSLGKNGCRVKVQQLSWGNTNQMQRLPGSSSPGSPSPTFDLVIAADVVYLENGVEPLLSTMSRLAGPDTVILLGYQVRSPEAHELFWRLCPRMFDVSKVDHSQLHPEYAFEEADVYILKKKIITVDESETIMA